MNRNRSRFVLLAVGAMLCSGGPVHAHLGSDVASVRSDTLALRGVDHVTDLVQYDLHDIDAATGVRVREFVTRSGTVFALSWTGPVPPDLQQLLGQYFPAYAAGLAALDHPGLQRSVRIALADLVVEAGGHLRAYTGRAYLPALVPAGVTVAELH